MCPALWLFIVVIGIIHVQIPMSEGIAYLMLMQNIVETLHDESILADIFNLHMRNIKSEKNVTAVGYRCEMYSPDVCQRREAFRSFSKLGRTMATSSVGVKTLISVAPAQMRYEQFIIELSRACKDSDDGCRAGALNALAALAPSGDPVAVTVALVSEDACAITL